MSVADNFIYDEALSNESVYKPFINKEIGIVYDSTNGNYNGQIQFSTNSLNSTGKWCDFQNSYLEIPLTISMSTTTADITAGANAFSAGLKCGSIQLVDSIIAQYNGTSMTQTQSFTNIIQNFRILSTWTDSDLKKWGPTTLTIPDDVTGMHYSAAASAYGDGISNNQVTPPANIFGTNPWTTTSQGWNSGFLKRMQSTAVGDSNNGIVANTVATNTTMARNTWKVASGATGTTVWNWNIILTLRLKDLHDFFNKIPLLKAARIDLTINYNAFASQVTYVNGTQPVQVIGAAGGAGACTITTAPVAGVSGSMIQVASGGSVALSSGKCCPYMISAATVFSSTATLTGTTVNNTYTGPNGLLGNNAILNFANGVNGIQGCSLTNLTNANTTNKGGISQCRWYVPLYEMSGDASDRYLLENPMKTIYYEDFYSVSTITKVTGTFTSLLSAGVKNPKYILMFPFFNGASNGSACTIPSYQSPFSGAPGHTDPVMINSLQVQVGGKSLLIPQQNYAFQSFMDEFSAVFSLNGGKSAILNSGQLGQLWWENSPVYVVDCSRRLKEDDGSPKSVQVSGTIVSASPSGGTCYVDIIAFIVYERFCTFNLENGLLESSN